MPYITFTLPANPGICPEATSALLAVVVEQNEQKMGDIPKKKERSEQHVGDLESRAEYGEAKLL